MTGHLSLAEPFTLGFYTSALTGTAAAPAAEVPDVYDVAVGGHGYYLDIKSGQFKHQTIPTLRPYLIQADTLGEKNINPESLWRASQNTWHKGAGQVHLDRTDSDPARFRTSKGVDVWTRWQLSLLPDTSRIRTTGNTNLRMAVTGPWLYATDGATLVRTADLSAFGTISGLPGGSIGAVCSDGYTVYVAPAGAAVYTTDRTVTAASAFATGTNTFTALAYVKGRLMAAEGRSIYNIVGSGAVPAALYQQPNTDFAWVGFAAGTGYIYAAGYSGDKSLIYKIGITTDGTALTAPIQAGELPDGEIVRSINAYLGFIVVGTSKGFRLCVAQSNGDLQVGPLVATSSCYAFEGQDRFIWFGWDNYDGTSTGLGRIDVTVLTDTQVPAYASDLMATAQGQVVDIATFNGKRVFTVAGSGFYSETANRVPSGTVDSGLISYDLPDDKVALYLNVKHVEPLVGAHSAYIAADGGTFTLIGSHDSATSFIEEPFTIGELKAEAYEIRQQLDRSASDVTVGPTLTRHTLQANPAVDSGTFITVPLLLVEHEQQSGRDRDPGIELAYLKRLRAESNRTTYQELATTYSVTVEDVEWVPLGPTQDRKSFNGTCVVKLKTV